MISRAVAIAQLPVTQLSNNKADLTDQSDELTKLDTKFTALQTAVQNIATALGGSSFQTSITDSNNVAAAIFWMKARAGWREKNNLEITGKDDAPIGGITVTFVRPPPLQDEYVPPPPRITG